uniref:Retrovirus-related Pol polyprotein from transposon TNT 1-94 n=1 Tax=Tanacetum cinerariifolium TaxID=118510 RepID=A0A6L2JPC7_TANCI|nr:retrovirus-related Pol polyprotein from transposon TNT 1-94 [Tanacetum cinerariifolium]
MDLIAFANKKQYIADMKVMNYLLQAIPNDIYNSVDACKDAKEMLERIRRLIFGSNVTNHVRHSRLMDEFDKFAAKEGESLESVEQMLLAMKDEAGSNLNDEENDFMLDNSFGDETLEELTTAVIMMAQIQPTNGNDVKEPKNDAKAVSEMRSLVHTRYNKTPYELIRRRKPNVEYFHMFRSLCNPTNDCDDLGKMKLKADIEYFALGTSKVSDNSAANTLDVEDTLSSSSIIVKDRDTPLIVTSSKETTTQESSSPLLEIHSDEQLQEDVVELDGN